MLIYKVVDFLENVHLSKFKLVRLFLSYLILRTKDNNIDFPFRRHKYNIL